MALKPTILPPRGIAFEMMKEALPCFRTQDARTESEVWYMPKRSESVGVSTPTCATPTPHPPRPTTLQSPTSSRRSRALPRCTASGLNPVCPGVISRVVNLTSTAAVPV